ncbi:Asp-tRNA(Asn)/Glu-tRNA(Gln) amidotransferase subunit GatC [Methanosarcinaceae archaeon]|nr:Asp-tRNA(Asn)/Glu-tRNA(Gln) amidotransferase subunit GatC [Methanosarcinaceae archaeon]MBQ3620655.1 Asp-tRNA(Asn)/Glu-tRNA(Gln) amidotransferase subunit GatC [Methanosarcinaceae archaeon]
MTEIDLEPMEELNEMALTPSEKDRMIKIFTDMAVYENRLQGIDTENIEIMIHVMPLSNVLREDIMAQPFTRESLLEAGPEHTEDSWQVPRLVK